jgi:hypothetical protein
MALLDITAASRDGITASGGVAASAGGDRFTNTGKELLVVTCATGGPVNVTMETTVEVDGQAVADNVVAVADGEPMIIGPFPLSDYGTEVNVSYADATNLTVQVIKVSPGV